MKKVSVVNYGIGNILSVQRAFEKIGCAVEFVSDGCGILQADYLVLPGVGAFGDGMAELNKRGLTASIKEYCRSDRLFLGICLGMQMMLDSSDESENVNGLGIVNGNVTKLEPLMKDEVMYKIPNIGWYGVEMIKDDPIMSDNISPSDRFYFVHSYAAHPIYEENSLAVLQYGGNSFTAVIKSGNCYGTQFHPEKSGESGLKLLRNFIEIG